MKNGFYPALGTPVNNDGRIIESSYKKQIELMIASGAAGLLCMGSMGNMVSIRNDEYSKIAALCTETASGKIPVMVGVMDCSVSRIIDRIDALSSIKIDGVVATAPFYIKPNSGEIRNFFTMISKGSKYPVYMYDLPSATQTNISTDTVIALMSDANIKGIKTANINQILELYRNIILRDDFTVFYSGLDTFDLALKYGICKNLDGMFTCTPYNSKLMYENPGNENSSVISTHLNNIIRLRNLFLKESVFPAYTYAMELLGCPGNYHPDYCLEISEGLKEEINSCMKQIQEI